MDNPRIEELKRRLQKEPASISFAQLAEECRRAGDSSEAVRVCREGLGHHPTYLSARVTLGRALLDLEQFPEAQSEFEYVLRAAPDNLAAIRGLAEIHQRRGEAGDSALEYPAALGTPGHGPSVVAAPRSAPPPVPDALTQASSVLTDAGDVPRVSHADDPTLVRLEQLLGAILAHRSARKGAADR